MDENLKQKIMWTVGVISFLVLLVSLIGNYSTTKDIQEDYIAVDRSPLEAFRLIDYRETSDGAFIDVVGVNNGRKYENNFISKTCPYGKEKKIGLIMQLSVVENLRTATNETFYSLDRAYDYLCTNLNMAEEDEKLFKRIKEARERAQSDISIQKSKPTQ
jgi:hypothetical protein